MVDSATYRFRRGLREGCPSSCVVFDLFHNLALLKLQQTCRSMHCQTTAEERC